MKRAVLFVAVIATLATATPAQAVTQTVDMTRPNFNFAFSPAAKAVALGDKVNWSNRTTTQHTSTGDGPLALWGVSAGAGKVSATTPALTAAGTYPYHCTLHPMKGTIQVPLTLSKVDRKITLKLSAVGADSTHKFVVQKQNGSSFATIATVTTATYVFTAPAAGTYTFRSALQKNGTTATAAFFSPTKSITVS